MDRRNFIKVCSASVAAIAAGLQAPHVYSGSAKDFARVKLVDAEGKPLKAASLNQAEAYVFGYPYVGTPCFLISLPTEAKTGDSLKTESGEEYKFEGGVGAQKNIVAYQAICTHQYAHPEKKGSVLSYTTAMSKTAGRAAVITCCAHNSAFDPADGGRVLTGTKAKQPLAAIRLEHDAATDEIYATGIYGAELIDDFFRKFKSQLNREFGIGKYREPVSGTTQAVLLSKYSANADSC